MIEDALQYPRRRDDALEVVVIGGILSILSVLIVPGLIVAGYLVRVYRRVMAGETTEPPDFADWEGLLGDGVRAAVIAVAYFVFPVLLLAVTVGSAVLAVALAVATGGAVSPEASLAVGGMTALGALVSVPLLLAAWYLWPAAIANFVRTDSLGAAFALQEVASIATDPEYVVAWVLALGLSVLASVLTGILGVTGLGTLLAPFVGFYVGVSMAYLYARGSGDATVDGDAAEAAAGRPAA